MTLQKDVEALRSIPLFAKIEPARLKLLAFTSERVQFAPGQRFFAQGDVADAAYVILSGNARVVLDTDEGEFDVAALGPDALVGEMGILADSPRSASVVATGATVALRIDKQVFLELLVQFPQLAIAVMRELAARLERTNAQLAAQARGG